MFLKTLSIHQSLIDELSWVGGTYRVPPYFVASHTSGLEPESIRANSLNTYAGFTKAGKRLCAPHGFVFVRVSYALDDG